MAQYKTKDKTKSKKRTARRPRYVGVMWKLFAALWVAVFAFFFMLSMGWLGFMPSFEELENPKSNLSSEVISDDGVVLGYIGVQNRSNVDFDEISPNLINALIATEDVRFYNHSGIDARSLLRVLFKTVVGGRSSSGGGSTITQQLAKNLFPRERKGKLGVVYSKFKEWVVAVKLEHNYSKEEILAMYLNTVDFGSNAFGIKAACKTFFDKTPAEVSVPEAATLIGLLKAPTAYSPKLHPDRSLMRRNTVLSQMQRYDYLSPEEFEQYKAEPIDMRRYSPQSHNEGSATYVREYLRSYMKEWCKTHKKADGTPYDVHKDGLKIYTTIDSRMQAYAEEAVVKHMSGEIQPAFFRELKQRKGNPFSDITKEQQDKLLLQAMKQSDRYRALKADGLSQNEIREAFDEKVEMTVFAWKKGKASSVDTVMSPWDSLLYYKKYLNVGMMSVEPGTGYVRAYVGGINYRYFKYDNVYQSARQVGSTFKPFVYTMALQDLGFYPCTEVPNSEVCFETWNGPDWCPKNSTDARENEMVTLKWALANSVNWVSAYLMKQGTPEQVINIARKMGVTAPIDPVPAICVGTPEITVKEMAGAMATFANKGEYVQPIFITRIEDSKGMVIERFPEDQQRQQAISEETAYLMLDLMKGVVQSGTGVRLNYKYKLNQYSTAIAGKTGTTQNNSDCWFVGITPTLATAIWTGGELRSIHFRTMTYGQGASMALPIFGYFMESVYKDPKLHFPRTDFDAPAEPLSTELDCTQFQQEIQQEDSRGFFERLFDF